MAGPWLSIVVAGVVCASTGTHHPCPTLTANVMSLSLKPSGQGCSVSNVANHPTLEQQQMTFYLFWYTEQQVKAQAEGRLRQAVWYRRAARSVGVNIMLMVKEGEWV